MKKMERQYLSRKKYTCSLCGKERRGNADTKSEAIICWCCTLKLISVKNEDLIRLWDKRRNAQPLIKNFMREVNNVSIRKNLDRKRTGRKVRVTNHRKEQITRNQ